MLVGDSGSVRGSGSQSFGGGGGGCVLAREKGGPTVRKGMGGLCL